ncbi:GntR family transcriptional regulator [Pseudothermotoga thermarum]|uniref:Transcriptional regulator, GntR family n=1 Tax=Pseudothermotoga thermarum DSM 5069 TaxID=688269 RepID=F7YUT5_9THEM|nr:GntR family transcriptional regulator [Pseudothermotoga thermarum]AEH50275.1 transcriptional regulator, GntR family [Pseudothermotoga thermarum DSM 5069]
MRADLSQAIYSDLKKKIELGFYKKGEKLPEEEKLAQSYGVGRQAVRKAMKQLADEGIVRRIKGRGTFVVFEPKKVLLGFMSNLWHFKLLKSYLSDVQKLEDKMFDEEIPIATFEILWLSDEKPVCFEKCHVDPVACPNVLKLLNQKQLTQHPTDFLSQSDKIAVINEKISIEKINKNICKSLQIAEETIGIKRTLVFSDYSGKVVAISLLYYHPEATIEQVHHL